MSQHGRIKVRTTAEQAEAKRKEREKKLKIYQQTTNRIYEKVYFIFWSINAETFITTYAVAKRKPEENSGLPGILRTNFMKSSQFAC